MIVVRRGFGGVFGVAVLAGALLLAGCEEVVDPAPPTPDPITWTGTVTDQSYEVGTAIPALTLPAAAGGQPPFTYSLTPAVPGLTFDPGTRTLTGTPTAAGDHALTYTATDTGGASATLTFAVTVVDPAPPTPDPITWTGTVTDQSYEVGTAIPALTLPAAAGGQPPFTYTLTPAVPGLTFDPGTRTLTGTPTTPGDHLLAYTATDAGGASATLTFAVTLVVVCPPAPASTNGIDLSGTLRDVETDRPGRGIVRAYDTSWNLLAESLPCEDGAFTLNFPAPADASSITLQAALGTPAEHQYVRTRILPARDHTGLVVKAVSYSDLNGYVTEPTGRTPAQFKQGLDEMSGYVGDRGNETQRWNADDYRGLLLVTDHPDPENPGSFTLEEQDYIVDKFEEMIAHVPAMQRVFGGGEIRRVGADHFTWTGSNWPDGKYIFDKEGWIVVKPDGSGWLGSAWAKDYDGDRALERGTVTLAAGDPVRFHDIYGDGGFSDYVMVHETAHVLGLLDGTMGHPEVLYGHHSVMSYGPSYSNAPGCHNLCPLDIKAFGIIYGYPAGTLHAHILALTFGNPIP